jgi:hypothetical protein
MSIRCGLRDKLLKAPKTEGEQEVGLSWPLVYPRPHWQHHLVLTVEYSNHGSGSSVQCCHDVLLQLLSWRTNWHDLWDVLELSYMKIWITQYKGPSECRFVSGKMVRCCIRKLHCSSDDQTSCRWLNRKKWQQQEFSTVWLGRTDNSDWQIHSWYKLHSVKMA